MTDRSPTLQRTDLAPALERVRTQIARCVIGMRDEVDLLLCAILAGRHVLLEGVPGIGKTHLVNTLARVLGCTMNRVQFTPDLLPADILGSFVYDPRDGSFNLRKGPIFAHVILADEINRAPAKTQSALLEVMQERQVTIEGVTNPIEPPFFVFATQNPIEHEGVYPLPQAQLDRFALRLLPDYPSQSDEEIILTTHRDALPQPEVVLDPAQIRAAQDVIRTITVSAEIVTLIVNLCRDTRAMPRVQLGASPRVALDLMTLGRARAALHDRDYVIPDDIKHLMPAVANHRIGLTPQAEIGGITPQDIIHESLHARQLV